MTSIADWPEDSFKQALPVRSSRLRANQEIAMKRCNACGEEFNGKFSFCPVDGTPLGITPVQFEGLAGFQLTLIDDEGLARRLASQVWFIADQTRQAWPSFKSDPIAFSARLMR